MEKITQLFNDLQQGDCWIGVNMQQALAGISAQQAARKLGENGNSIWQLVNHLVYWRETVILRLQGEDAYPPGPDFATPAIADESAWKNTLHEFNAAYVKLLQCLSRFDTSRLDKPSPKPGQTFYQLIMGCLQHDGYHMGQIVLLKKH